MQDHHRRNSEKFSNRFRKRVFHPFLADEFFVARFLLYSRAFTGRASASSPFHVVTTSFLTSIFRCLAFGTICRHLIFDTREEGTLAKTMPEEIESLSSGIVSRETSAGRCAPNSDGAGRTEPKDD
ncbi:hypothetical protein [Gordonibacter pamelaeae]|uniref:hypothetical protein n=1 Tax=Gordonibacter pamelaeae TaxID=471189 RepID=UPI00242D79D4|nr:hypothetical protein [Gordonibacter pamelaeae]